VSGVDVGVWVSIQKAKSRDRIDKSKNAAEYVTAPLMRRLYSTKKLALAGANSDRQRNSRASNIYASIARRLQTCRSGVSPASSLTKHIEARAYPRLPLLVRSKRFPALEAGLSKAILKMRLIEKFRARSSTTATFPSLSAMDSSAFTPWARTTGSYPRSFQPSPVRPNSRKAQSYFAHVHHLGSADQAVLRNTCGAEQANLQTNFFLNFELETQGDNHKKLTFLRRRYFPSPSRKAGSTRFGVSLKTSI
jgi:hypothetical protein